MSRRVAEGLFQTRVAAGDDVTSRSMKVFQLGYVSNFE